MLATRSRPSPRARAIASHSRSRWRWQLGAIVVVAVIVRVAIIAATPHVALYGDPVDYQRHAVSIATGNGYPPTSLASPGTPSAFRPPAYPFLLGGVYAVVGVHLLAARVLSALLGVLTVALMAYLGRAIWNERVALVAAGLTAIFLPLAVLDESLLSESLFIPLELALAWCLLRCVRAPTRWRWVLLSGFLCGLAVLTRVVADLWLLPVIFVVASASPRRLALRRVGAVIAVFLATLAPWTIRNALAFHAFVPISTEGGFTMAGKYNREASVPNAMEEVAREPLKLPSLAPSVVPLYLRRGGVNEAQLDRALRAEALNFMSSHPRAVGRSLWLDTLRLFDVGKAHSFVTGSAYLEQGLPRALQRPTTISAQVIAALALLALFVALGRRLGHPLGPVWLWSLALLAALVTVPFGGNPRKRLPLDPFLILLASLMIVTVLDLVHRRARPFAAKLRS